MSKLRIGFKLFTICTLFSFILASVIVSAGYIGRGMTLFEIAPWLYFIFLLSLTSVICYTLTLWAQQLSQLHVEYRRETLWERRYDINS